MNQIELTGLFKQVESVIAEYGKRTNNAQLQDYQYFTLTREGVEVFCYDDRHAYDVYNLEMHTEIVPWLAFTNMDAAVQKVFDEKAEKEREAEEAARMREIMQYVTLKRKFENSKIWWNKKTQSFMES